MKNGSLDELSKGDCQVRDPVSGQTFKRGNEIIIEETSILINQLTEKVIGFRQTSTLVTTLITLIE